MDTTSHDPKDDTARLEPGPKTVAEPSFRKLGTDFAILRRFQDFAREIGNSCEFAWQADVFFLLLRAI